MRHYLITDFVVYDTKIAFWELLDEQEFDLYMYAKHKLKSIEYGTKYLPKVDILQFCPMEISNAEFSILNKYEPKGTYPVLTYLLDFLNSVQDIESCMDDINILKEVINEIAK